MTVQFTQLWNMTILSTNVSQGSVATHLRCGANFCKKFTVECDGKRTLKIGQHLTKLQAKV